MPDFQLYNTLARAVEPFAPADGRTVRMYTCGPTVYNPAHLGNFRTFLFEDLLRRALRLRGWAVEQAMNLTDVDDKIIRRAVEQGKTIREVTEPIVAIFHQDRAYLRIEAAEHYPKATDYIPQMIALVERLVARGVAYQAEDGSVYFAISRFPGYGRLSRLDTREIKAGARVAQDDYTKENAQDFALWKAAKDEDERTGAAWDSPWGRGRPGWHLECSAMAMDILGETLDLHCGGIDLVFPHHEDEIAQSEAATGATFARVWCHGEFLLTDGAKMAKRVGNVQNVEGLREAGISAAAVRHLMFSTHYRQQLNLQPEALEAAVTAVQRLGNFADRLAEATGGTTGLGAAAAELERAARAALFDDLNAPEALAALHVFVNRANAELDTRPTGGADALEAARAAFAAVDGVLDVLPERTTDPALAAWVEEQLAARRGARARRDFAAADAIRAELTARGVAIEDTPAGTRWKQAR
ncbi:MAG: Cysteinyl-tRNA synthetase [uncultured Gemmatimonadaceae bacterium]|uniref:Cysteine--tRNA ligase n=1 Tax=uncultured Gemmatimonadaceae bacterium TaxID=246130 RepID=A0A6J4LEI5_9BACT|nr:MAG: Cysteinyl-tRNA synthetase [uncultured Gemmatimonadaceae bacterium]